MDLAQAIEHTYLVFKNKAILVKRETWQALDVRNKPDMATHELTGYRSSQTFARRSTM